MEGNVYEFWLPFSAHKSRSGRIHLEAFREKKYFVLSVCIGCCIFPELNLPSFKCFMATR